METNLHFWSYLDHFFLEWEMFRTKVVEKIKTHILCSITYFQKLRCLWDKVENIAQPDRPQMKIWRKRIACCVRKATNTHSECVTLIDFPFQKWCTNAPQYYVIRGTYIASLCLKCKSVLIKNKHISTSICEYFESTHSLCCYASLSFMSKAETTCDLFLCSSGNNCAQTFHSLL